MNAPIDSKVLLSEDAARAFEREIAKYPPEQKASAVIACLAVLQAEHGFISPESEELVAEALDMPVIAVHEVTTFYNMFNQVPVGRVKLNVCTNLPCQLRGGQHALEHLCTSLGIEEGGTTADGAFTCRSPRTRCPWCRSRRRRRRSCARATARRARQGAGSRARGS